MFVWLVFLISLFDLVSKSAGINVQESISQYDMHLLSCTFSAKSSEVVFQNYEEKEL